MLGICCHYLSEQTKPKSGEKFYFNEMEERSLQLGRFKAGKYTNDQITGTYVNNVKKLAEMIPFIHRQGVKLFRVSSALFPLGDKVERELWDNDEVKKHLKLAGDFIINNGMRVSTHPGQFCVLSSDSDDVIANARADLDIHAWIFDMMGLPETPYYAINIHGGKSNRIGKLIDQINKLPDNIRKRLTLENDESAYSVLQLLEAHRETGLPITFDSHHHTFNTDDLMMEEAYEAACATWGDIRPLQHISKTDPVHVNGNFTDRRKHSDLIHYVPDCQLNALRENKVDVEVEAKLKNISVMKMSKDFEIPIC